MSGLVNFFRGFLSPAAGETEVPSDENAAYRQSLSSRASHESSLRNELNGKGIGRIQTPEKDANAENDRQEQDLSPTTSENNDGSYKAWREERNAALEPFMLERLFGKQSPEGDNSEEEEEEDYEVPDNDGLEVPFWGSQLESQEAETQELAPESQPGPTPVTPITASKKKKKKKRIIHVYDTTNDIDSLESIDLNTKLVHLSLLQIEKVWGFRRTQRGRWLDHSGVETTMPMNNNGLLPMSPFKSFEDDGPLATLFGRVTSVEVTQLHDPTKLEQREKTAAAFGGRLEPHRLRIFFMGKYAHHVSRFLSGAAENSTLLMALENIPAKCVLPYQMNTSSWYDRETLSPFCLCIGDKSTMQMVNDGKGSERVRFDSQDLKITLASQQAKKLSDDGALLVKEVQLTSDKVVLEMIEPSTTSVLASTYQEMQPPETNEMGESQDATASPAAKGPIDSDAANNDKATSSNNGAAAVEAANTSNEVVNESLKDGPRAKRSKTMVEYQKLDELGPLDKREVNVYGTVLGFSSPCRTKRDEWMISITITDESLRRPNDPESNVDAPFSIIVIVFNKNKEHLPKLRVAGDVIRCHRVIVQFWQGEIQLAARPKSSFVVIRPNPDAVDRATADDPTSWTILPTAKKSFTFDLGDYRRADELWHWAQQRILSYPTILKEEHCIMFKDLQKFGGDETSQGEDISRDLTVMVTAIFPLPDHLSTKFNPRGFLRVWDGTGAPRSDPLPVATSEANRSITTGDPPAEALVSIRDTVRALLGDDMTENDYNAAPSRFSIVSKLEPPKKLCGRVVNAPIWEEPHWELVQNALRIGSFIRLRNVQEKELVFRDVDGRVLPGGGLQCIMVYSKSHLTPLPRRTYEVRNLLEKHCERIIRSEPYNPQSGLLPLDGDMPEVAVDNTETALGSREETTAESESIQDSRMASVPRARRHTLAQCIKYPPSKSFQVTFRILRTVPDVDKNEIGLHSLCAPKKGGNSSQKLRFRFCVHLSDGTGELDAIVADDLAASILGRTADDACKSSYLATEILHVMTRQDAWNGTIRSILFDDGAKYFILESASIAKQVDDELSSLPAHTW